MPTSTQKPAAVKIGSANHVHKIASQLLRLACVAIWACMKLADVHRSWLGQSI
jgi:hypothetical protein